MIKRLAYIVTLLLLSARLSYAFAAAPCWHKPGIIAYPCVNITAAIPVFFSDTSKFKHVQNRMNVLDLGGIKEVAKAKRQPKPEKVIAPADTTADKKPRSKRRPEGMERPPDIIRRNNN